MAGGRPDALSGFAGDTPMNEERPMTTSWRADPLVWGHGPRVLEVFLEPTCPFSVKAFGKLDDLLRHAGEDRVTVKLRLQSQPWHMYSGVIVRCIVAASTLEAGKLAAKSVLAAVAAHVKSSNSTTIAADRIWMPRRMTSSGGSKTTAA